MSNIIGKWVLQGGMFDGLWFDFKADGTYQSELPRLLKVTASGTYAIVGEGLIDMQQAKHSMGMVGKFEGRFAIEGDTLTLAFSAAPGGPRPADLSGARVYKKSSP
jgi:hypothetical protein